MIQGQNGNNPKDPDNSGKPLSQEKKQAINGVSKSAFSQLKKQPKKKLGFTEKMWGVLIRPSNRVHYDVSMLGPKCFLLSGKVMGRREDFQVKNSRGFMLECSYFEPTDVSDKRRPCLLYLHGNASSRLEGLQLLGSSLPYGLSLVLMDFAGCGISQGEYISMSYYEKDDAKLVMDYVRKWKDISEFGIWGRSMGAATALMTALEVDQSIRYVVVDSCFLSVQKLCNEVVRSKICLPSCMIDCAFGYVRKQVKQKAQFDLQQCDILSSVINSRKRTNLPSILFLAAKDDALVKCNHSQQLFAAYSGAKQINIFEGTHNSKRPREILEQVAMFFYEGLFDEFAMTTFSPNKIEAEHLLFFTLRKASDNQSKDNEEEDQREQQQEKERNIDRKESHSIKLEFKKKRRGVEDSPQLSQPFSGKSKQAEFSQFVGSSQAKITSNFQQSTNGISNQRGSIKQSQGDDQNDDKNEDFLSRKIKINPKRNENVQILPPDSDSSQSSFSDRSICRAADPSKCKCNKIKRKTQSTQFLSINVVRNPRKDTARTVATTTNQQRENFVSESSPHSQAKADNFGSNNLLFSHPAKINLSTFSNVFSDSPQLVNQVTSPAREKIVNEQPIYLNSVDQSNKQIVKSPEKQQQNQQPFMFLDLQNKNNKTPQKSPERESNNQTQQVQLVRQTHSQSKSVVLPKKNEENLEECPTFEEQLNNEEIIKSHATTSSTSIKVHGKMQDNLNKKQSLIKRNQVKRYSSANNQNSSLFHPNNNSVQTNSSIILPNSNKNGKDEMNCEIFQVEDPCMFLKPDGTIESDAFLNSQKNTVMQPELSPQIIPQSANSETIVLVNF